MSYYDNIVASNKRLTESLRLRWTKYIPHAPTPRQRAFLLLNTREGFYGGAAGGGKSDALLMGALQYADLPNYSAIIFRRTIAEAELKNSIIDRAHNWLGPWEDRGECKWIAGKLQWRFNNGATIQFAYLSHDDARHRYQSAEFQFVGFDELTHFTENQYRYLLSRIRRTNCPLHEGRVVGGHKDPLPFDPACHTCREYSILSRVPLRMRAASNPPDSTKGMWVKNYFRIRASTHPRTGARIFRGYDPKRPFVPAKYGDNPYIDQSEYDESLSGLDPVTRAQLKEGNWTVSAKGRIDRRWCRRYKMRGRYILPQSPRDGTALFVLDPDSEVTPCRLFQVLDPAASAQEGYASDRKSSPSSTALATFLLDHEYNLYLLDMFCKLVEIPSVLKALHHYYREWSPEEILVEKDGIGKGVVQIAQTQGLPIRPIATRSRDKLTRATDIINRFEQGRVYLPDSSWYNPPWLEPLEDELFGWTAAPDEPDDQIDVFSYAGMHASQLSSHNDRMYSREIPVAANEHPHYFG